MQLPFRFNLIIVLLLLLRIEASSQDVFDSSTVHFQEVIYFDSGKFILKDSDNEKLDTFINSSKQLSKFQYFIDAHTDDVGSEASNMLLSQKRKDAIHDYLLSSGIHDSLITSMFHGENKLLISEKDSKSRQLNRRATIQLISTKEYLYLEGSIIDEDTSEGLSAEIELNGKGHSAKEKTDSSGYFKIISPVNEFVQIDIIAEGYLLESSTLKITDKHIKAALKIPLPKVKLGRTFVLKNLLFEGNRSVVMEKSYRNLEQLKKFMIVNQNHCIEIAGHVNVPHKPKLKKNTTRFELSVARSLAINTELERAGIKKERMLSKGYGNWKMIYPYAKTHLQKEANRRVVIIISDCDSLKSLTNDNIKNPGRYELATKERNYRKQFYNEDISVFSWEDACMVWNQIEWLEKNSKNPTDYTYQQLLINGRKRFKDQ